MAKPHQRPTMANLKRDVSRLQAEVERVNHYLTVEFADFQYFLQELEEAHNLAETKSREYYQKVDTIVTMMGKRLKGISSETAVERRRAREFVKEKRLIRKVAKDFGWTPDQASRFTRKLDVFDRFMVKVGSRNGELQKAIESYKLRWSKEDFEKAIKIVKEALKIVAGFELVNKDLEGLSSKSFSTYARILNSMHRGWFDHHGYGGPGTIPPTGVDDPVYRSLRNFEASQKRKGKQFIPDYPKKR